ncbi:non-ribosomal peptide synthetase [Pseudomonas sp. p99-361]|uniref:amino acid adenylation domain-containing protein n=1 Tax=Pseudomonas sp. p99-361 TaxID=2479852 RepID=UPI000F7938E4|nr:non-ribosomal peptide synthetase [Pseudomonas sp. p99-361]RRV24030.1 non-ribosomal peptide synthetase [Pseudomonas sp. p99-361]
MNVAINAGQPAPHQTQALSAFALDVWVEAQRGLQTHQFTVALSLRLPSTIGPQALHEAAGRVMQGEPACTRVHGERQGIAQAVNAGAPSAVQSCTFVDEADAEAFFEQWAHKVWDLTGEPLLNVAVGQCASRTWLIIRAHHLVADSWALDVLARKILDAHDGGSVRLRQASQSGRALAAALAPGDYAQAIDEVAGRYGEAVPMLFGKSGVAACSSAPAYRRSFRLAADDVQQALEGGITPFMSVSAALAVLLSCQYGSERFFMGVPFLNRDADNLVEVGQRANTLPVAVSVNEQQTFREIATAIKQEVAFLKGRQSLPFGRLVSTLARAGHPRQLFDASISYLRYPAHHLDGLGVDDLRSVAHVHSQDAVAIHLHSYGDCAAVRGEVCLNSSAFANERCAAEFLDTFVQLVECFQDHLDQPVSAMNLLTAEQANTLEGFEDGPCVPYSEHETVMSLFEACAGRNPQQRAVLCDDGTELSYAQLDAWAAAVAVALEQGGVGRGDIVAVSLARSPRMLAAIFGVLKTGAAYLPIDSEYPQDRIQYMLEDSQAKRVISDLPQVIAQDDPRWFDIDAVASGRIAAGQGSSKARARDPAYVIYTSGSTGRPKGVVVEHHSVVNRLEWMQALHPLDATDVILQKTPVSFDVSVWELFWWSMTGASVALLAPGAQRDPRALIDAIRTQGVTVAHFVPSMLEPYVQALVDDHQLADSVASLRCLFTSGEALSPAVVNRYRQLFGEGRRAPRLVNLYGPTEATVDVTYYELALDGPADIDVVPIGFPIHNTSIRIVSQHGVRQPIGIPGELQIGGVQLARGYLNRAELTAERFITDTHDNRRWYRSGDLACWAEDGSILYLGRMDGQVKIRGNRIELGEIKSAMLAQAQVLNAEVLVEEDEVRGKHLVAVYVSREPLDERSLRRQLATRLPAFMVPARFVALAQMPLTPNGKFDRARALQAASGETVARLALPEGELQSLVAGIWCKVLGQQAIACDDDFYSLGGDSILMLKVRSELEHHGYEADLSALGEHTRLSALAHWLGEQGQGTAQAREALPPFALVSDVERKRLGETCVDAYPVSQLQLGLLFHSRETRQARAYKDVFRYTLDCDLDEPALRHTLAGVIERHPALRTRFNLNDYGRPLQLIGKYLAVDDVLAVANPEAGRRERDIERHMQAWARHDYRFAEGPLFNVTVFPGAADGGIDLILSFHHAILDGGSVANLMRELLLAYANGGQPDLQYSPQALPNPSLFIQDERTALAEQAHRSYWQAYLEGAANTLPAGLAGYLDAPTQGVFCYRFEIDRLLDAALGRAARAAHLPIKLYYQAAHCLAIGAMSGVREVTTGVVTHARPEIAHSEHILGLFLNTLPLRVELDGHWQGLVERLNRLDKHSHRHRRLPLSAIQESCPGLTLATAFNYIHFHVLEDVSTRAGIGIRAFEPLEETSFAILANVMRDVSGDGVSVRVDMDASRYAREQARVYASLFNQALAGMAHAPQAPVAIGRSIAEAGQWLLPGKDDGFVPLPRQIAEMARRRPQAAALVGAQGQWDYARLWREVSTLAARLADAGAAQGDVVGVALPRSFEQIATVVAIAALGAVCLPIDLAYPASRIELILGMATPKLVVTRAEVDGLPGQVPQLVLDAAAPSGLKGLAQVALIEADDPAYILFTSGSTGTPKGVTMPHRGLANLVAWQNRVGSGAVASTLQYAPLSFDVSFQEIFASLAAGSTLHVIGEAERRDPAALLRHLDEHAVQRVFLPYVALQQLAETAATLDLYPRSLRVVGSSGEQLRVTPEIRTLMQHLPASLLENQYGPTETHVVTSHTMSGDPRRFPALPPIGRPIDGVGVLILDEHGQLVPDGVPGELCIYGQALASGYYRAAELSAEKFVANPHVPGRVYYRTGDIGIRALQGEVISLGRNDSQVKVRGYRVEPSEIELKILSFFQALGEPVEVAVIARPRDQLDAYLVAYLVSAGGHDEQLDALRAALAEQLPAYMVPTHIVNIDRMPTTPSGKRDDAALRARELHLGARQGLREPRGEYETRLCQLASELLKIPQLAPEQSIFDCGATSLTAMRLVVLVEKLYGINVPLSAFVSAPTMEKLAQLIERDGGQLKFDPLVPLRRTGQRTPLFLVHPMGGNILSYLRMLPHLPQDQPLYALQASGVDLGSQPIASVEAQAAFYIEALRKVQPHGPYLIGGWSYGGFVAFEIANQLIAAGERVDNVLVLDTMALSDQARGKASDDGLLSWFFWELLWTSRGSELPVQLVPAHIESLQARFDYITDHAIAIGAIPEGSTKAVMQRLFEVYRNNWDAATEYNYQAKRPPLDITLVRARKPLPRILREMHDTIRSEYNDPLNGWAAKTSGQVRLVEVEGDHLTIMEEPFVGPLVAAIMDEIQRGSAS